MHWSLHLPGLTRGLRKLILLLYEPQLGEGLLRQIRLLTEVLSGVNCQLHDRQSS